MDDIFFQCLDHGVSSLIEPIYYALKDGEYIENLQDVEIRIRECSQTTAALATVDLNVFMEKARLKNIENRSVKKLLNL